MTSNSLFERPQAVTTLRFSGDLNDYHCFKGNTVPDYKPVIPTI